MTSKQKNHPCLSQDMHAIHLKMSRSEQFREIPHVDLLSWTFGNPDYDHDKPLFIDPQNETISISHRQAKSCVRKLIAGLHAWGLRSGESICLQSYNNVYYSIIYLAIIGAGGRFVGANPAYTPIELNHLFKTSDVKFVIVEPDLLSKILPTVHETGVSLENVRLLELGELQGAAPFVSWTSLLEHGEEEWVAFDDEFKAKATIAALMSTSGTTGLPKAAEISHYALVSQSVMLYDSKEKPYEVKRLLCLPQFHAFAAPLSHLAPLREGHKTYIMRRYHPETFVHYLNQYQITETALVNPIVFNLLLPQVDRKLLAPLRFAWVAGAPLEASVQNQLSDKLHKNAILCQVWGLTEVGWITTFHYPEKDITGSVGRLLPNVEARIVDESTNDIDCDDSQGEILIKSPSVMTSYFNNPDATNSMIIEGWLRTGDIGYCRKGKWYIVDRAKELIKVRGWQVAPMELEACLLMHPAIRDTAVIGVNFFDGRGELPRAYVVLDPELAPSITDKEIQDFLASRLAKYKALAAGVKRVDAIPRSNSGKILKKILREEAKEEMSRAIQNNNVPSAQLNNADSIDATQESEARPGAIDIRGGTADTRSLADVKVIAMNY